MSNEMLEKFKQEHDDWIRAHDGMVPSEDLEEFERDANNRWWLIQQAEEKIQLEELVDELVNNKKLLISVLESLLDGGTLPEPETQMILRALEGKANE